jgi:hypothetical protein
VAIEIPTLATDRLPHPEWGSTATMGRFALAAARLLIALEGAPLPPSLLAGLRQLVATGANVELLVAPDRGLVQVVLDGRRLTLAGAARNAALHLLGELVRGAPESAAPVLAAPAAATFDASLAARVATVDAQIQGARAQAHNPAVLLDPESELPATTISAPLLAGTGAGDAGVRLAHAIEASGLFLESHLAQWLRGERSLRQIQDEMRLLPNEVLSPNATASEQRAQSQLDALQRQTINLNAQAWPGQAVQFAIEREHERAGYREAAGRGDATGMFQATLRLELPRLGTLQAQIRVMDGTIGVRIESARQSLLAPELGLLAEALTARGLNLAGLSLTNADLHRKPAGGG